MNSAQSYRVLGKGLAFLAFLSFTSMGTLLSAEEIIYDPYASYYKQPGEVTPEAADRRDRNRTAARILEQPIRPVGYGIGKTAEYVERRHIDDKVIWFFDELHTRGIFPKLFAPHEGSFGTAGLGGRVDVDKLFELEQSAFSLDTFGGWSPNVGFAGSFMEAGASYGIQPSGYGFHQNGLFKFSRSSSESFYGIGESSSLGEWSTYKFEELFLEGSVGGELAGKVEGDLGVTFQHVKIGNGNRERVGKIKEHFAAFDIPGIEGANIFGLKSVLEYDYRDHKDDPRSGGYANLEASYNHDLDGKDLQYARFALTAARFIPILSDRRVLAVRFRGETNEDIGSDDVPFYNMARLGGSKPWDGSELLRGYRFNRFFDQGLAVVNAEYRYSIYEYGDFQTDAAALFDIGEVFDSINSFSFPQLNFSYGGGLNFKYRRKTFLSVSLARSSEGTALDIHSKVSF